MKNLEKPFEDSDRNIGKKQEAKGLKIFREKQQWSLKFFRKKIEIQDNKDREGGRFSVESELVDARHVHSYKWN